MKEQMGLFVALIYLCIFLSTLSCNANSNKGNHRIKSDKKRENHILPKRLAVLSSTHIAYLDALDALDMVCAISGKKYIHNEYIIEKTEKKEIVDVGFGSNISIEKLIEAKPDLIIAYESAQQAAFWERLEALGFKVSFLYEYLEPHPLGKLGWIKWFGEIVGKEHKANKYYQEAASSYDSLTNLSKPGIKPKVLINMLWNGQWFLAGGQSYIAQLIKDAGGEYILSSDSSRKSKAYSFESILSKGIEADKWIHLNQIKSLNELKSLDPRYTHFKAYKSKEVYNNNRQSNNNGGIGFWENGTIEPHIILEDLIHIFHPELDTNYQFVYYQHLK